MNFKEATDLLSMSLEEIAGAIGRTYATVLAYRTGGRVPPKEVTARLAQLMRERAMLLLASAEELDSKR